MKYEIEIDGDMLVARAWGAPETVDELRRYGADLVAECIVASCSKALLDERGLEHTLNVGEVYSLAEQYAMRAPRLVRVAILFHPKYHNNVDFWETCAVNRGLTLKVFTNRDEAIAWLNGDVLDVCA